MKVQNLHNKAWFRMGAAALILLLGISSMAFLASTKEETKKKDVVQRVRKVATSTLDFSDHTLRIHGNGTIESQHTLDLVTLVGGQVIYSKGDLKSGLMVKAGEVLLKIDDREAQNYTRQARSGLINAIVSLIPQLKNDGQNSVYQKWSSYLEQLNIETTPDLPEITDAQERIRVSMHNIFNQHAMVKNAEITLERHTIRAPFDGYLLSDGAKLGAWLAPGQIAASIIDPYKLEIAVPLAVSELKLLSDADFRKARVFPTEDHDKFLHGHLSRQNAFIDKRSQTVTLHVVLENPDLDPAFLPGNYMDVYIDGIDMPNVALLPRDVIVPGSYIYALEDSILVRYPVQVLATQEDTAIIAAGSFPPNTQVITTLIQSPIIGMRIAPLDKMAPTDSTAADA
jgi:RND family efflux transporter MFP subunit